MTYPIVALKRLVNPDRPITYGIVQAGDDVVGGVPYIRPVDMQPWASDLDPASLRTTSHEIAAAYRRSRIQEDDVVVSIGPSFGKLLLVPQRLSGANLTQGTARVAPAPGVCARFLQYALASSPARAWWQAAVGGATFGGLNLLPLSLTPVPKAPQVLQPLIADLLDREYERISSARLAVSGARSCLDELDRHAIDAYIRGGASVRLGWVADVQTGLTLNSQEQRDDGVAYLRVANVQADRVDLSDVRRVVVDPIAVSRHSLRVGDVLMTEGGDLDKLGRGTVWNGEIEPCLHQNHVFAVRVHPDKLAPEFLAEATRSSPVRRYFEETASRVTNIASTNVTKLRAMPLPLPPLAEQGRRLAELRAAKERTAQLRRALATSEERLAEYRDALITEAVTGQLDLSDPSEARFEERLAEVAERPPAT